MQWAGALIRPFPVEPWISTISCDRRGEQPCFTHQERVPVELLHGFLAAQGLEVFEGLWETIKRTLAVVGKAIYPTSSSSPWLMLHVPPLKLVDPSPANAGFSSFAYPVSSGVR